MKAGQYFALSTGVLYFLFGVFGYIPDLVQEPVASAEGVGLGLTTGYGYLFGLFPINALHNVVHIVIGLSGIFASLSLGGARLYSGLAAIVFGLLALLGLFPPTESLLGLMPIFGNDVWLNAATAAIAIYFGFIATPDLLDMTTQSMKENTPVS